MTGLMFAGRPGTPAGFGGLDVIEELGRGAHAVVYRVRRGESEYALKTLRTDTASSTGAAEAVRREAGLLACVDHPAVGRVYEVGDLDGAPYLVLELIEGVSLAQTFDHGPLPVSQAVRLVADVAGALAAAHRVGVVHRDVTPQNIMVLADGRPKLVDFGLATQSRQHGGSQAAGTFSYAAPEQTGMLARPVDGRADLYGLGVVLFECLTGTRPFVSADVGELVRLHAVAVPPDVTSLRPEVPRALAAVVNRLLAKDPDDRYQDGEELAADLLAVLDPGTAPTGQRSAGSRRSPSRRPLVGRRSELARLQSRWEQARGGAGGAVRVVGPPGIGKSRLVDELCDHVRAAGYPVLTLTCSAGAVPLAPLRVAVDRHVLDVERLPAAERTAAVDRLRTAAGVGASVLQLLSPVLANILNVPSLPEEDRQDQLGTAVADFLRGLASASGGLVLRIEDAQWLDDGIVRVLRHLGTAIGSHPLLVVATERTAAPAAGPDGAVPPDSRDWLPASEATNIRVTLRPLDEPQIAALAATQLGGTDVDSQLSAQLSARSAGNPFAVLEYLRAMVDAGAARPYWGSWSLDERMLDRLALPEDVLDLVVARVDALPGASRRLLGAAAAIGTAFRPELLAEISGTDVHEAVATVEEAVGRGVLEIDGGRYAFLHLRVREALLADMDETALRSAHQRIAEAMDGAGRAGSEYRSESDYRYALARHYAEGELDRTPGAMLRACFAAADAALADQSPAQALEYLALARRAAERAAVALDSAFHRTCGLAQLRVGRLADARASLEAACVGEPDPLRRGEMFGLIAQAEYSDYASTDSVTTMHRGLAEIGHSLPTNPVVLLVTSVAMYVAGLLISWTGRGRGTAAGATRERYRIQVGLYDAGAHGAAIGRQQFLTLLLHLRNMYLVHRLGPGPEYVRLMATYGLMCQFVRSRRLAKRCYDRAFAGAAAIGDPRVTAQVAWLEAIGLDSVHSMGPGTGSALRTMLQEHGRWLELGEYASAVGAMGAILTYRGYAHEAAAWYERGRRRMESAANVIGNPIAMLGLLVAASTGSRAEIEQQLAAMRELDTNPDSDPAQRIGRLVGTALAAVEHGDLDDLLADAAAEMRRDRVVPRKAWPLQRVLWLYLLWVQLARCRSATDDQRPARMAEAKRSLTALRRAGGGPALRAYYHVAAADHLQLAGEHRRALRRLARADLLGLHLDVPMVGCEIAAVRARALQALGQQADAARQARHAVQLATELGWVHRARRLRSEFRTGDVTATSPRSRRAVEGTSANDAAHRRLTAMQQISVAAATVLDPQRLAQVALDATVRIFAAERAILFLPDPTGTQMLPHLGRGADGTDLDELSAYSSTLVDQVRQSRAATVMTSSEGGVAVGAQSVVLHGLRSVLVAPLQLKGDLLGVVYLDSRVAKGVFTPDDVDILEAITNQIAASMVTARAAQLEASVSAAERRSELADTMRTSMVEISRTLDPDTVLTRLLATLVATNRADLGLILRADGDWLSSAGTTPDGTACAESSAGLLAGVNEPRFGDTDAPYLPWAGLLPGARSWIAVPLVSRERRVGRLLLLCRTAGAYDDGPLRVTAALAEQGMIAYDNACLFSRVEQMARTDALTMLANRGYFFQLGRASFAAARDAGQPINAVMLDVDHFKSINDTHGHSVGDDVIREVANRLRDVVGGDGILGRYGGEEFALVLPGVPAERAADLAEAARRAVADTPVQTSAGPTQVTISAGLACFPDGPPPGCIDDILNRADSALYLAKQQGRNRVVAG
jgi:diguanylate cyclase (GGDEF)-like protein